MITLGLTGTVERIEGGDVYCSVIDDAGMRGSATFEATAMAQAGIGAGDTFRYIYESGHLEKIENRDDQR